MGNLPAHWHHQLHTALHTVLDVSTAEGAGYICGPPQSPPDFAYPVPPLSQPELTATKFPTLSAAVEEMYHTQHQHHYLEQRRQRLRAAAERKLEQVGNRRRSRQSALEQAEQAQRYRHWGELILAHLAQIPPRASEITVPDIR